MACALTMLSYCKICAGIRVLQPECSWINQKWHMQLNYVALETCECRIPMRYYWFQVMLLWGIMLLCVTAQLCDDILIPSQANYGVGVNNCRKIIFLTVLHHFNSIWQSLPVKHCSIWTGCVAGGGFEISRGLGGRGGFTKSPEIPSSQNLHNPFLSNEA